MERGREKPAEGLGVLSATAVLGICILHRLEQLLFVHEVQKRVGGREVRKESHLEPETYTTLHGYSVGTVTSPA